MSDDENDYEVYKLNEDKKKKIIQSLDEEINEMRAKYFLKQPNDVKNSNHQVNQLQNENAEFIKEDVEKLSDYHFSNESEERRYQQYKNQPLLINHDLEYENINDDAIQNYNQLNDEGNIIDHDIAELQDVPNYRNDYEDFLLHRDDHKYDNERIRNMNIISFGNNANHIDDIKNQQSALRNRSFINPEDTPYINNIEVNNTLNTNISNQNHENIKSNTLKKEK